MYVPDYFCETDGEAVRAVVDLNPLCALIVNTSEGLIANHLPVLWHAEDELLGHVALANPLHRIAADSDEALAIFTGESAYVSPNWYPSKQANHRSVPTWNYVAVHFHGHLRFAHDEITKRKVVASLTRQHEQATNGEQGWRMSDAPLDYMQSMLESIVAFRFCISRVTAKFKLSQNRSREDVLGAAGALEAAGKAGMARSMRARREDSE
jgi:transcriptional regulator